MYFNRWLHFILVCGLGASTLVFASTEDTQQPITIEADHAVLDEQKQTSVYSGNVILRQGGIEVNADTITVYAKDGQLQRIIAEGNPVQYRQHKEQEEDIHGVSRRMEYEAEIKRLVLSNGAELWQGKNHFSGERIQYDPNEERVVATSGPNGIDEGKQRVQITLQPRTPDKKPSPPPAQGPTQSPAQTQDKP